MDNIDSRKGTRLSALAVVWVRTAAESLLWQKLQKFNKENKGRRHEIRRSPFSNHPNNSDLNSPEAPRPGPFHSPPPNLPKAPNSSPPSFWSLPIHPLQPKPIILKSQCNSYKIKPKPIFFARDGSYSTANSFPSTISTRPSRPKISRNCPTTPPILSANPSAPASRRSRRRKSRLGTRSASRRIL